MCRLNTKSSIQANFVLKFRKVTTVFKTKTDTVVLVKNIVKSCCSQVYLVCSNFDSAENFFNYPCNSDIRNIFMVSTLAKHHSNVYYQK